VEAAPEGDGTVELLVFAASSLTDAFDEMIRAFEVQNPGVRVVINYGGSSGLATQLLEGGVADIFASANSAQMQRVVDAGEIVDDPQTFATNRLVVIVPSDNPGGIETLADLANPGLLLILAMRGVPVRDYTDQMFAEMAADPAYGSAYSAAVYANLVSEEENVRQVAAKVALGEADAGVVYTSDITPDLADRVRQIEVPDAYNVIAAYPIAHLANAPHPDAAAAFLAFVLSDEGQSILNRWGFGSARP
jgi:molybdate transport system substrate-binding protein